MSDTQVRTTKVSLERGNNPALYAQRLFVQFLQGLFNFNPAGCFHWEPGDDEKSEIVIVAEAPVDQKAVGKRPLITVVLGPLQYQGLSIDQLMFMNMWTERKVHSDLISGHFVVYCLAESDVIAQWLAHVVVSGTMVNRRLLESPGGFHQIARPAPSINSPSPPGGIIQGDPHGLVMVQVNLPFTFQWTWSTEPKAPSKARDLKMVTQERRAADFPYTSPRVLEKVELAMSTSPVLVRRLGATTTTVQVTEGTDGFQAVVTDTSTDEA